MTIEEFLASILQPQQPVNRLHNWHGPDSSPGAQFAPQAAVAPQGGQPAAFASRQAFSMPQQAQAAPAAPVAPQQARAQPSTGAQPSGGGFLSRLFGGGGVDQNPALNETAQWLEGQGYDPGTARAIAGNKQALQKVLLAQAGNNDPLVINNKMIDRGTGEVLRDYGDNTEKTNTFGERETAAQAQGLQPGTPEYQRYVLSGELPSNRDQDPSFKNEMDLRKEYADRDEVKYYVKVRDQYERLRSAAQKGIGAGDIAMVYTFMKMLDPGSTVMQGEQATAQNAAGTPSAVRAAYNKLIGEGTLDGKAREDFLRVATDFYRDTAANLDDVNVIYSGVAGQWGVDPKRVLIKPEEYSKITILSDDAPAVQVAPGVTVRPLNP